LIFMLGPTLRIFETFGTMVTSYAREIIPLSNWIDRDDRTWYHGWTVFYWAWWISWAPAVGIFIARISRGRTVREFVLAVLLIPTVVTLLWMSVMGGTALKLAEKGSGVLAGGITDVSQTMFEMFSQLPLSGVISLLALMLILLFLITSYHSGSQMVDDMATGGLESPSVTRQLFWIAAAGGIATLLLISGGSAGLASLQAGTTGLPFTIVLIMMCLSLSVGLKSEWHLYKSREGDKQ
jgi:BCCT family betaine/carnitine transporter